METANDLFLLIKSMTKSEKRYFKLNSGFHEGEKDYVRLFDLIEKQSRKPSGKYSEVKIISALKTKPFHSHIAVVRNRLYDRLLHSLELFENNVRTELRSSLTRIEILYNRELFSQAEKIHMKAKKLAEDYEQFITLAELAQWEVKLIRARSYKGETEKSLQLLHEHENKNLELHKEHAAYSHLNSLYFLKRHSIGHNRSDEQEKRFDSITNDPYLKDPSRAKTFIGKFYFNVLNSSICYIKKDFKGATLYARNALESIEAKSSLTKDNQLAYIHALHNLVIYLMHEYKMREADIYIEKLKAVKPKVKTYETLAFFFAAAVEIEICTYEADFKRADSVIPKIEEYLSKNEGRFSNQRGIELNHIIAVNYFIRGQYKKTLLWINKTLNDRSDGIRSDLFQFARILNLLVHYELENFDLLENKLLSTYKALDKKNALFALEDYFISFLKNVLRENDFNLSLKKFKQEIDALSQSNSQRTGLEYFDFNSWVISKQKKIPMAEILKEKAGG